MYSPADLSSTSRSITRSHWPALASALRLSSVLPASVWIGLLVGSLLVAYGYALAATVFTGTSYFQVFWIGILIGVLPAFLRLCDSRIARAERLAILAAVGLFNYLPKILRDPQMPLYHDELAHWRQSELTYSLGRPFIPNPTIDILQYFPGLHLLTAELRYLTGLPTYQIGQTLLAVLHVVTLIGIFAIAERITRYAHIAALAAFIYSLNPSFMYFDSQYSYESLGIVFFIWVVSCLVQLQAADGNRREQAAWFTSGTVLAAGCIVTHHISSYIMVLLLWLFTAVSFVRLRRGAESRGNAFYTLAYTTTISLGALAWLLAVASSTVAYLSPAITGGLTEVFKLINRQQSGRTLFAASIGPVYEHDFAFIAQVIAAAGALLGIWLLWDNFPIVRSRLYRYLAVRWKIDWLRLSQPRSTAAISLILFGLLYFPSIPFILTQSGNEGARRSWAFTYVGLCILLAWTIPWLVRLAGRSSLLRRRAVLAVLCALIAVMQIGNVASHMDVSYRFPGPYVYGSDTRSLTTELLQTTQWFKQTQGTNRMVVADRYSALSFSAFGTDWIAQPSSGFPAWQLYFSSSAPSSFLLDELEQSHYQYMIVDTHMVQDLPVIGVYFEPDEPQDVQRSTPPPAAAIAKFESLPWVEKIYMSDHLEIFRFNFAALDTPWTEPAPPKQNAGRLTPTTPLTNDGSTVSGPGAP